MPLEWCAARTAAHRSDLSTFRCADPEYIHFDEDLEEEWYELAYEIEVQERINGLAVPCHAPEFVLLGYAGDKLAAVIELLVQRFDNYCQIRTVGVANWAKRNGYGREAVSVVARVMEKYDITRDYTVQANIDPDNDLSQAMFAGEGFVHVDMDGLYQRWARRYE